MVVYCYLNNPFDTTTFSIIFLFSFFFFRLVFGQLFQRFQFERGNNNNDSNLKDIFMNKYHKKHIYIPIQFLERSPPE